MYPLSATTALHLFTMLLDRFWSVCDEVFFHSSLRYFSNSSTLRGLRCSTRRFRSLHRFSMGLRSGEYGGKSSRRTPFLNNQLVTRLALCEGALSCSNHQCSFLNNLSAEGSNRLIRSAFIPLPFMLSLKISMSPRPYQEKQAHIDILSGWASPSKLL